MAFEMTISGLCAFVRKSCKLKNAQELHVLMLNHKSHEPKLVVNAVYLEPVAKGEDPEPYSPDEVLDMPDGQQLFIWNLRGYRLDFDKPPRIGIREGTREPEATKPDYAQGKKNLRNDFSWIPELHRALGVGMHDAMAPPQALDQDMPPGYVSSRLMKLEVNSTEHADGNPDDNWVEAVIDNDSMDRVFAFESGYEQVLADRVLLTLNSEDAPLLKLYSYAQERATRRIRLRRLPREPKVSVSVSNLPSAVESFVKGDPLKHFMAFYDLAPGHLMAFQDAVAGHHDAGRMRMEGPREHPGVSVQPVKCAVCATCGGE